MSEDNITTIKILPIKSKFNLNLSSFNSPMKTWFMTTISMMIGILIQKIIDQLLKFNNIEPILGPSIGPKPSAILNIPKPFPCLSLET